MFEMQSIENGKRNIKYFSFTSILAAILNIGIFHFVYSPAYGFPVQRLI